MMQITTWNCNGAFRKKFHAVDQLSSDLLVVQECENPHFSSAEYRSWSGKSLWTGLNRHKGMGIFSSAGHEIEALHWPDDNLQQFIPCRINKSFNLLAVWTKHAGSPNFRYIGQFWKYLQINRDRIAAEPIVICGDFNSNARWDEWDRWWNHSDVIRELEALNIQSLYHLHTKEPQGKESQPTFFLHRKLERPYHIDYAFASTSLVSQNGGNPRIGHSRDWLQLSDHMPVTFNIL